MQILIQELSCSSLHWICSVIQSKNGDRWKSRASSGPWTSSGGKPSRCGAWPRTGTALSDEPAILPIFSVSHVSKSKARLSQTFARLFRLVTHTAGEHSSGFYANSSSFLECRMLTNRCNEWRSSHQYVETFLYFALVTSTQPSTISIHIPALTENFFL